MTKNQRHTESHCDAEHPAQDLPAQIASLDLQPDLWETGEAFEGRLAEILLVVDAAIIEAYAAAAAGKTLRVLFPHASEDWLVVATYCHCGREALSVVVSHAWDRGIAERRLSVGHLTWERSMLLANSWKGIRGEEDVFAMIVSEVLKDSLRKWVPDAVSSQVWRATWVHLLIHEREALPGYSRWVDTLRAGLLDLAVEIALKERPESTIASIACGRWRGTASELVAAVEDESTKSLV